jgi:hypothetical protein
MPVRRNPYLLLFAVIVAVSASTCLQAQVTGPGKIKAMPVKAVPGSSADSAIHPDGEEMREHQIGDWPEIRLGTEEQMRTWPGPPYIALMAVVSPEGVVTSIATGIGGSGAAPPELMEQALVRGFVC